MTVKQKAILGSSQSDEDTTAEPKYVEDSTCPECGSDSEKGELLKDNGSCVIYGLNCGRCGAEWEQQDIIGHNIPWGITYRGREFPFSELEAAFDFSVFDAVEVGKCVEIGDSHDVVRIEEDEELTDDVVGEPFWSVYMHYDPEKSESRGVESICDCWDLEHAIVIAETLRQQLSVMAG